MSSGRTTHFGSTCRASTNARGWAQWCAAIPTPEERFIYLFSCCACVPCGSPVSGSQQLACRLEPRGTALLDARPGVRFLCLFAFTYDGASLQENAPPAAIIFQGVSTIVETDFSWFVRARAGWPALAKLRHQIVQTKQVSGHGGGCPRGGWGVIGVYNVSYQLWPISVLCSLFTVIILPKPRGDIRSGDFIFV